MLPQSALSGGRSPGLGAAWDFHHGLLASMKRHSAIWLVLLLAVACQPGETVPRQEAAVLSGEVTHDELLTADQLPGHWLTYSGGYRSWRYSRLDQVDTTNVHRLSLDWVFQFKSLEKVETTPLVVNGVMYVTQPPSDALALDVRTGRPYWEYRHKLPERTSVCCGRVNRGHGCIERPGLSGHAGRPTGGPGRQDGRRPPGRRRWPNTARVTASRWRRWP